MQIISTCEHIELDEGELEQVATDFYRPYHDMKFYSVKRICVRCWAVEALGREPDDPVIESIVVAYDAALHASSSPDK